MTEYLPDPIERGESRAERYVSGDKIQCCECQRWLPDTTAWMLMSPDPYGPPVCPDCFEKITGEDTQ